MQDLTNFLETLVLSTNVMDKKYRDGVPSTVQAVAFGEASDLEASQVNKAPRKSRSKKIKPGKNGLYPDEDSYIGRWWQAYASDSEPPAPGDTREAIIRRRIASLRERETQLQTIVILERLALQALLLSSKTGDSDLPLSNSVDDLVTTVADNRQTTKSRKELAGLIDIHIDRLCIWQSVAEETKSITDKLEVSAEATDMRVSSQKKQISPLRDFCVDVIAPL